MRMGIKPGRACSFAGCSQIVMDGFTCSNHKKQRETYYRQGSKRKEAALFYNSMAWKTLRLHKMTQNPFCEHCQANGVDKFAVDIHHVLKRTDYPTRALDITNLMSLCKECHTIIEKSKTKPARPTDKWKMEFGNAKRGIPPKNFHR